MPVTTVIEGDLATRKVNDIARCPGKCGAVARNSGGHAGQMTAVLTELTY